MNTVGVYGVELKCVFVAISQRNVRFGNVFVYNEAF